MTRGQRLAYYGLPMLFCLAVHWLNLRSWFLQDDFAWLGLRFEIHSWQDLLRVLFVPEAQGTVRTLSERLFFLILSSVFGLESWPFRTWVFLTQFANIALLIQITRRLTGSATAGLLAAILWTANAGLAISMGWSSAYNEIALAFFILLAFRLLLLYIDTGERKFWVCQWLVFVLGFGALELNVVYPAIAAGYAWCCARKYFRKTLLLFIPSILYTIAHFAFVPVTEDPHYRMYFDWSMFGTLWQYWSWTLGAVRDSKVDWRPLWLGIFVSIAITSGLVLFAAMKLRRGRWLAPFLLAWFFVVIAPLLPLRNHYTEYYVTVPAIGLAILGAWAVGESHGRIRAVAVALAGVYLAVSITDSHSAQKFQYERSRKMKYLITGLQRRPNTPAKKILLTRVDNSLFWSGFYDDPFRLIGITEIYLAPGSEGDIDSHPEWGGISRFVLSKEQAWQWVKAGEAAVYELHGRQLVDVTALQLQALAAEHVRAHPEFVDVADAHYQDRLGPTWYPVEDGFRWMPKRATVKLGGPKAGQNLEVTGYCPAILVEKGPVEVWFRADGRPIGSARLKEPNQQFNLKFPMPAELVGKATFELEVEVSRTVQSGADLRPLGLIFGTFTMK